MPRKNQTQKFNRHGEYVPSYGKSIKSSLNEQSEQQTSSGYDEENDEQRIIDESENWEPDNFRN